MPLNQDKIGTRIRTNWLVFALLATGLLLGYGKAEALPPEQERFKAMTQLFRELLDTEHDKNFVFSPYSTLTALQMAQLGAAGNTLAEINAVLGDVASPQNPVGNAAVANAVFYRNGVKLNPEFAKQLEGGFRAFAQPVDFTRAQAACTSINNWVEKQTYTKIKNLIPDDAINPQTRLVLVNALYFKDAWEEPFNVKNTSLVQFTTSSGEKLNAHTMHKSKAFFNYAEVNDVQVLVMPYKNGSRMTIYLPRNNTLAPALQLLADASRIEFQREPINLALPKFKIEASLDLIPAFKKLGIRDAFSDAADFSKIADGNEPIRITDIIQGVFIEVDETGTTAAAATSAHGAFGPIVPVYFVADHPFLFTLSAPDGTLLFAGVVRKPSNFFIPH